MGYLEFLVKKGEEIKNKLENYNYFQYIKYVFMFVVLSIFIFFKDFGGKKKDFIRI